MTVAGGGKWFFAGVNAADFTAQSAACNSPGLSSAVRSMGLGQNS